MGKKIFLYSVLFFLINTLLTSKAFVDPKENKKDPIDTGDPNKIELASNDTNNKNVDAKKLYPPDSKREETYYTIGGKKLDSPPSFPQMYAISYPDGRKIEIVIPVTGCANCEDKKDKESTSDKSNQNSGFTVEEYINKVREDFSPHSSYDGETFTRENNSRANSNANKSSKKEIEVAKDAFSEINNTLQNIKDDWNEEISVGNKDCIGQEKSEQDNKKDLEDAKGDNYDCVKNINEQINLDSANLVTDANFQKFSLFIQNFSEKIEQDLEVSAKEADKYLIDTKIQAMNPREIANKFIEEFNHRVGSYIEELESTINTQTNNNLKDTVYNYERLRKDQEALNFIRDISPISSYLKDLINAPDNKLSQMLVNSGYKGPESEPYNQLNFELTKNAFLDIAGDSAQKRIQNILYNTMKYVSYDYLTPHIKNTLEFLRMANDAMHRGNNIEALVLVTAIERYSKTTVTNDVSIEEISAWDMSDYVMLGMAPLADVGKKSIKQLIKQLSLKGKLKKRGLKLVSEAMLKIASKKVPGKGLLEKASKSLAAHEKELVFREILDIIKVSYKPDDAAALIKYASRKIGIGIDDYIKAVDVLGIDEVTRLINKETDEIVDTVFHAVDIGKLTSKFTNLPSLRKKYVIEVISLRDKIPAMRNMGMSMEEIARVLHAERRALGVKYKDLTPPNLREKFLARNVREYGDELGPTIEWFRKKGKSWEEIIEGAITPGGQDLGF
jgi:hypothetical protein